MLLKHAPLGQKVEYSQKYDASLLFTIPRSQTREELQNLVTMYGYDLWNAYELSWLNAKGKPEVGIIRICIDAASSNIIESKSLKLYLNSINNTHFTILEGLLNTIRSDISTAVDGNVVVELLRLDQNLQCTIPNGICIDDLDVRIDWQPTTKPNKNILEAHDTIKREIVYSNILRSNCLITNQPDFGTVVLEYEGLGIDHESLLIYFASFRNHQEFHEQCVERIFCDIWEVYKPKFLKVYAHYTRRGGIDICPYRTSASDEPKVDISKIQRFIRQ